MDYTTLIYYYPDKRKDLNDQTTEEIKKCKNIYAKIASLQINSFTGESEWSKFARQRAKLTKTIEFKSMDIIEAKKWIKNIKKQKNIYLLSYDKELNNEN